MASILLPKYPWASAWQTFLAGATLDQISDIYQIPRQKVTEYAADHKWNAQRSQARQYAMKAIKESLTRRVEEHKVKHQNFILDELERTQEIIEETQIGDQRGQMPLGAHLQILKQQDELARRTLRLDDDKSQDSNQVGVALLIAMRTGKTTQSGVDTLLEETKANMGILSQLNGIGEEGKSVDMEEVREEITDSKEQPGDEENDDTPE